MTQHKEFQGKSLDDAIREACDYYGVAREKLEIEIISDAKSGIFGLVGAKKATIRASRVHIADTVSTLLVDRGDKPAREQEGRPSREPEGKQRSARPEKEKDSRRPAPPAGKTAGHSPKEEGAGEGARKEQPARDVKAGGRAPKPFGPQHGAPGGRNAGAPQEEATPERTRNNAPAPDTAAPADSRREPATAQAGRKPGTGRAPVTAKAQDKRRRDPEEQGRKSAGHTRKAPPAREMAARDGDQEDLLSDSALDNAMDAAMEAAMDAGREEMPEFALEGCDQEALFGVVREVILRLVEPIVGPVPCQVEISGRRVRATLDCGDASGLLVGRDGQTLASVQYLAARIVSRRLGGAVRLQIDAGKYRERQDDKLRELALFLAAKVKQTGHSQSTRPLSAYQRRIVHLTLEQDAAVQTRSKGEGVQRRVVIYPHKEQAGKNGGARPAPPSEQPDSAIHGDAPQEAVYREGAPERSAFRDEDAAVPDIAAHVPDEGAPESSSSEDRV